MKLDPQIMIKVMALEAMPENTAIMGSTIAVNIGGPSPEWVLELLQTKAGKILLRRVIAGLLMSGKIE